MLSLEAKLERRRTPAGRDFERRMIKLGCNILSLGALGLLVGGPWLVVPAAIAHLLVGFIQSLSKTWWAIFTVPYLVVIGLAVAGLSKAAHIPVIGSFLLPLGSQPPLVFAAQIVVLLAILAVLFAHAGGVDELVEYKNKYGELPI